MVGFLRELTSYGLPKPVNTESGVTSTVEDTLIIEVRICRVEVSKVTVSVLTSTQNMITEGVPLGTPDF